MYKGVKKVSVWWEFKVLLVFSGFVIVDCVRREIKEDRLEAQSHDSLPQSSFFLTSLFSFLFLLMNHRLAKSLIQLCHAPAGFVTKKQIQKKCLLVK